MKSQNLTIRDQERWDACVNQALVHEAFHSWNYHTLNEEGEPVLFVNQQADFFIALPIIKRPIAGSTYFDMTSVYGYGGPVSNVDLSTVSQDAITEFKNAFVAFMNEERAVCIFTRLHPFGSQKNILDSMGGIGENGSTIYIDLSLSIEEQQHAYNKRLLRQIRKMRNSSFRICECSGEQSINDFADMYYENMVRLNASSRYFFNRKYFISLLNMPGFDNKLIMIYNGEEPICGAILLISKNIIRNHLSATSESYVKESPSKLLTDEIRAIGYRTGKAIFHLGGGVGGSKDSLYEFKKQFSDLEVDDHVWRFINNQEIYDQLVVLARGSIDLNSSYFPLYRQPKRTMVLKAV